MNKEDPELILGKMRCLEALGEWYTGSSSTICCFFFIYRYPRNFWSHWFVADGPNQPRIGTLYLQWVSFYLMFLFRVLFSRLHIYSFISNPGENMNFYTLDSFFSPPLDIFPLSRGNLFDISPLRTMWKGLDSADQSGFYPVVREAAAALQRNLTTLEL